VRVGEKDPPTSGNIREHPRELGRERASIEIDSVCVCVCVRERERASIVLGKERDCRH